jgi:hypothetical protein
LEASEIPPLFSEHPMPVQVVIGVVIPFVFGALVGVVLGVSAGAYWVLALVAGMGAVLAGLEHRDARGGAMRGIVGGALFGAGILIAHAIAGNDAKVSLGSVPLLLIPIDAVFGAGLGAIGGRNSRRSRAAAAKSTA